MTDSRNITLDYLRIFACLWVFSFHWTGHTSFKDGLDHDYLFSWQPDLMLWFTNHGNLGVDVFFVISGVVIGKSIQNTTPKKFAIARFLRLYPVFLIASLLTLAIAPPIIGGGYVNYIYTLSGLQYFLKTPILIADSWTLEYEIIFYFLMYSVLWYLSKRGLQVSRSLVRNISYLYFLVYLMTTAVRTEFMDFIFRLDGMSIYFILGMFMSTLETKQDIKKNLLPLFLLGTATYHQVVNRVGDPESRFYAYFCLLFVAALMVYLIFALTVKLPRHSSMKYVKLVSLMTYPFYLLHETFGLSLAIYLTRVNFTPSESLLIVLILLCLICYAITVYFEPKVRKLFVLSKNN